MKQIFLALMITASSSHALIIAEMFNNTGGKIVITDEACNLGGNARLAYTTIPRGRTDLGCWAVDEEYIHIRWQEGNRMMSYPLQDWTLKIKNKGGV